MRMAGFVAVLALGVAGCGSDDDPSTTAAAGDCEEVEAPEPAERQADPPKADSPTASGVAFATNCGSFAVSFDDRAPKTTASVESLVEQGFYDGLSVHRAVGGFLIQGGDPLADGTGGPGYTVDEPPPRATSYTEGTVAMAKTEDEPVGRSGSQFLIAVAPDIGLSPDYALVGEVSEGFDVVQAISELAPDGEDGEPTMPVVIEKATLEE